MGVRSDVAMIFPKDNWDKILEESKTDKAAQNKYGSFDELLQVADVTDTEDSKVLKFYYTKWYDLPGNEAGVDFLQRMQKKYDGESLIVTDLDELDVEHEYPYSEVPQHAMIDYNIFVDNVDLSIYDKTNILKMIVKDYKNHDPENFEKFRAFLEKNDKYLRECKEFKELFY